MSDDAMPDLSESLPPPSTAPRKEHWKVKAKREREAMAARRAESEVEIDALMKDLPPTVPQAPVASEDGPDVAPIGKFMSWSEFCGKVAVEAVMSAMWHQKLAHVKGQTRGEVRESMKKDPGPFYNVIRRAYIVMSEAYGKGTSEFGE